MTFLQLCEPGQTPSPHEEENVPQEEGLAVGIDLGTTHSLIAFSVQGRPVIFEDNKKRAFLPSVMSIDEYGNKKVGFEALDVLSQHPNSVIRSSKRLMGKSLKDIQISNMNKMHHVDEDNPSGMVGLKVNNQRITPVEVGMNIIQSLKMRVEKALGASVVKAVVTVPAYFDDAARQATQQAAELANIKVLRLINEPTAAALAYGLDQGLEGLYAVYDFGGGTFDVSLLQLEKEVFRVLSTGGDAELGGDDIDQVIADCWLKEKAIKATKQLYQQLLFLAKKAKEHLSEHEIFKEGLKIEGKEISVSLTLEKLQHLVCPIIEQTLACCEATLKDKNKSVTDLKGVILVGGSTKMPYVQEKVAAYFQKKPLCDIDPEKVVAYGAALQAEALSKGAHHLLLDVIPLSLGLETMGGLVEKIIDRNTPIPVTKRQEFTTYKDGQSGMRLHVVQGEREKVKDCRSLASFSLKGIPNQEAGHARIEVTFQVDADGLLTVRAQERVTGINQEVQVKATYGLDEEDMTRLVLEGFEHAQEDMNHRLLVEEQVEAKRILQALDKALEKDGYLLQAAEEKVIRSKKEICEKRILSTDRTALQEAMKKLEEVTENFSAKRMNQAIQQSLRGQKI